MAKRRKVVIDFESEAIQPRPEYPPKPVGVSIKEGGKKAKYHGWGHPAENNCSKADAKRILAGVWKDPEVELVFHNAAFDLAVAAEGLGLPVPPWHRIHCTMIKGFLTDPHCRSLKLKDRAHADLGIEPTERDELQAWICQNVAEAKKKKSQWGAYIAQAPGGIVGKYADGDTTRTWKLHEHYSTKFDQGLHEAYDRERHLLPILLKQEREGICVDLDRLELDHARGQEVLVKLDGWIRKRLKSPDLNIDSDDQLADALDKAGLVKNWILTEKGNRSVSGENLAQCVSDKALVAALGYRGPFVTCLNTFMGNWLRTAQASGGRIYTQWNQTRSDKDRGARTGRLSSQPNLQNIPTDLEKVNNLIKGVKELSFLPPLPLVRSYIIPDNKNHILIDRDYNSQEMRIFSHFEDGDLCAAYQANPWLDTHQLVTDKINELLQLKLKRKAGKTLNFGMLYGEGLAKLAHGLDTDIVGAKTVKKAYLTLLPGAKSLGNEMRDRARAKQPIRTLGGRLYYCEEPRIINGRMRTFDYKLINYLVQGSSADETKEAIINYHEHPKREGRWLMTVHDENAASVDKKRKKEEMLVLKEAMENALADRIDVPMLSNGSWGPNFQELEELPDGQ